MYEHVRVGNSTPLPREDMKKMTFPPLVWLQTCTLQPFCTSISLPLFFLLFDFIHIHFSSRQLPSHWFALWFVHQWAMTHLSIRRETKATPSSSTDMHTICQVMHQILKVTSNWQLCQSKCWTPFDAAFTNLFNEELIFSPLVLFFGRGMRQAVPPAL